MSKTTVDENGIIEDENGEVVTARALTFKTFADCANEEPKSWLIKGVIALNEDSSWFGPPGALKSTVLTDIAVHIASGRNWRGHEFTRDEIDPPDAHSVNYEEHRGVVIFALERAALTRRRLAAYKQRDNLPADLPIIVVDEPINLMDPACVEIVSDTIYEFERQCNGRVGLVVFDTWSKCLGGHDEDKANVQQYAALNLQKIRKRYRSDFHIAGAGHTGKNLGAGERGNNARRGHIDMEVLVNNGTAKITKGNDMSQDDLATFAAEEVTVIRPAVTFENYLGPGRDLVYPAEPWTVSILAPYDPAVPAAEARPAASQRATGKQTRALNALTRAIAERGQHGAVHVDFWKGELARVGLIKPNDSNPRATFSRIRKGLTQHITDVDGLVRLVPQPGQIPPCPL